MAVMAIDVDVIVKAVFHGRQSWRLLEDLFLLQAYAKVRHGLHGQMLLKHSSQTAQERESKAAVEPSAKRASCCDS